MFHSGYGFNPEMAYGQYSPIATPLPSIMVEGQLYPPQQIPFSPSYYPQHGPPNVPSALPVSPSEMMTSESSGDNLVFGPSSGYFVHFGSYGVNVPGNPASSPLTSPAAYPQPMGILGSYEQNIGQVCSQLIYHVLRFGTLLAVNLISKDNCLTLMVMPTKHHFVGLDVLWPLADVSLYVTDLSLFGK